MHCLQCHSRRLRLLVATLAVASFIAACSGPAISGDEGSTPTSESFSPTALASEMPSSTPVATTFATAASAIVSTATAGPTIEATPQAELTPSATLASNAAETTPSEPQQAPVAPTPWLPDDRPEDQRVELPDLDLHYAVHITELSTTTGFVQASEIVTIREFRSYVPDLLYFQIPAAGYGFFTLEGLTLNGSAVEPGWLNGGATMVLDLPDDLVAPVEIGIDFHLNVGGPEPEGWGYLAVDTDVLRLGYWFPQISDDHPFSLTLDPSYTRVATFDVTLDLDPGLKFSHSGEVTGSEQLLDGRARYQLHGENIRDFDFAFSPSYVFASTVSESGVTIEYAWRGGVSPDVSSQVLNTAADAVDRLSALLGPYPWPTLRIADAGPSMPGGIEYGNHIWINPAYPQLDRLIYHEVSHMWFYGIIGTRTLDEGWIDEGGAEFFERGLASEFSELAPFPAGGYCCPLDARWEELPQTGNGTYYAIYEQGQHFYMAVLAAMGWDDFWTAMQQIYADYALDIVTAYDMLRIWQAHSAIDLRPLYADYFRYSWISDLPPPGVNSQQGWLSMP